MISGMDYEDRRVVVSGGSSGMGDAAVGVLLELGAEVHVLDLKPPSRKVASYKETDLRSSDQIHRAVGTLSAPIDALFNCAGMPDTFPPLDVMVCNFCGTRELTQAVLPLMSSGGAVASIASIAGMAFQEHLPRLMELVSTPDFAAGRAWCEANPDPISDRADRVSAGPGPSYGFSKMAVVLYTKLMAARYVDRGIRFNTLSPGATDSPMMPLFVEVAGKERLDQYKAIAGRFSTPLEQGYALVFLNSPGASYVNGCDLVVDGGFTATAIAGPVLEKLALA
jgi:NAD(P)-dependent dehydrogenase (short-subunit alcohol dehydrogenase family)